MVYQLQFRWLLTILKMLSITLTLPDLRENMLRNVRFSKKVNVLNSMEKSYLFRMQLSGITPKTSIIDPLDHANVDFSATLQGLAAKIYTQGLLATKENFTG